MMRKARSHRSDCSPWAYAPTLHCLLSLGTCHTPALVGTASGPFPALGAPGQGVDAPDSVPVPQSWEKVCPGQEPDSEQEVLTVVGTQMVREGFLEEEPLVLSLQGIDSWRRLG